MKNPLTACKACGQEMAKNAKTCPHCGAKNKKPILKKWWFWVIIALFIAIIAGAGNSGSSNTDYSDANSEVSESNANTENSDSATQSDSSSDNSAQKETVSLSKQNAVKKAKSYLRVSAFSRQGLIEQLEFEGFNNEDAVYGVDNCGANWNEQAAKKAESYLRVSAFSRQSLIDQLEFEGFTPEQAIYGVDAVGL